MNEYTPWEELGISELDYWKMRHIEQSKRIAELEKALHLIAHGNASEWRDFSARKVAEDALEAEK